MDAGRPGSYGWSLRHFEDAKRPDDKPDCKKAEDHWKAAWKPEQARPRIEGVEDWTPNEDGDDARTGCGVGREAPVQASLVRRDEGLAESPLHRKDKPESG